VALATCAELAGLDWASPRSTSCTRMAQPTVWPTWSPKPFPP